MKNIKLIIIGWAIALLSLIVYSQNGSADSYDARFSRQSAFLKDRRERLPASIMGLESSLREANRIIQSKEHIIDLLVNEKDEISNEFFLFVKELKKTIHDKVEDINKTRIQLKERIYFLENSLKAKDHIIKEGETALDKLSNEKEVLDKFFKDIKKEKKTMEHSLHALRKELQETKASRPEEIALATKLKKKKIKFLEGKLKNLEKNLGENKSYAGLMSRKVKDSKALR